MSVKVNDKMRNITSEIAEVCKYFLGMEFDGPWVVVPYYNDGLDEDNSFGIFRLPIGDDAPEGFIPRFGFSYHDESMNTYEKGCLVYAHPDDFRIWTREDAINLAHALNVREFMLNAAAWKD